MFKAVLFDLDNTLLDFMRFKTVCCRASVKAMIEAGLKMGEDEAYKLLIEVYAPTLYEDDHIFEKFLKKTINKIDYKLLSAAIVAYRRIVNDVLIPYPEVPETLAKLKSKGLMLGVVTDAPRIKAWIRLTTAKLSNYFDFMITLGDSKKRKPHKTPYNKALKQLKIKPNEALFVGDNPERDIKGAKEIGMTTVLAKYGTFIPIKNDEKEKPHHVIDNFEDLLKIV